MLVYQFRHFPLFRVMIGGQAYLTVDFRVLIGGFRSS